MKATMLGHDGIVAGSYGVAVVGGMESMTNAPYLLPKARGGYRLGHGQILTTCSSTAGRCVQQGKPRPPDGNLLPKNAPTATASRAQRRTNSRSA